MVIPAEVRRLLGVSAGDQVQFLVLEDGHVELVTPQMLAMTIWANNHGGDALDSTAVVRSEREQYRQVEAEAEARIAADADQPWDEQAETARLLASLGLNA